jgi:hypothetical protein
MLQWKSSKYYIFCLAVGKEAIRIHFRQKHPNRWKACKGCSQSKMLMSEPLPSTAKELQAMSRSKLKVAVGLLTVHIPLALICLNSGSQSGRIADCAGTKKKIVDIW